MNTGIKWEIRLVRRRGFEVYVATVRAPGATYRTERWSEAGARTWVATVLLKLKESAARAA